MRKVVWYCCLLILSMLTLGFAYGQHINFKHYTITEGLSQNTVLCLMQDREGFIWVGTEDGLNRFDGYEFINYRHENDHPKSISSNHINALMEDTDGKIWVGTSAGLNIFDRNTETFDLLSTRSDTRKTDYISSIFKDSKNNIWIGTFEGLKRYDRTSQSFELYQFYQDKDSLEFNKIYHVGEGADNMLWVCGLRDLKRFDPGSKKYLPLPVVLEKDPTLKRSIARYIASDSLGNTWIASTNEGLFVYNTDKNKLTNYRKEANTNSLPSNIVRIVSFVNDNEVFVGTRDGLSIFNRRNGKFRNYNNDKYDPRSLSHNSVRSIIKDKSGNIWIGTFTGGLNLVNLYERFSFIGEYMGNNPGLSYRVIGALASEKNGGFWAGTEGGGLNFVTQDISSFTSFDLPGSNLSIFNNTIKALYPDGDSLWIGTYSGLLLMNKQTRTIRDYPINSTRGVQAIIRNTKGLWLGTNSQGLICIDRHGKQKIFRNQTGNPKSISGNNITAIVKDESDNLWIGTERGLNYFDGKAFTQFLYQPHEEYSLNSNNILSVCIDRKGRIWVGTKGGGLNLLDRKTKKFYALTEEQGLGNNVIHAIEEDDEGILWVSTNKGISRISIKEQGTVPLRTGDFSISNYTYEDGLHSSQFSSNASFKDAHGTLYFGGINGIIYFNPSRIKEDKNDPDIVFTDFLIRNRPANFSHENSPLQQTINETKKIVLSYDQAFITIKFAALNFLNPGKTQYAYRLENFSNDDDWHYVGNQRTATFTNLDAGEYILRVKATNNDGIWSDKIKEVKIIVLPPWWKTWWAYLLYIAFISGLLYLFYSYSLRNAKLKNELFYEHLSREKEQELAEQKLNFFTNISHEIKTPLTLILTPLEKLINLNEGNNKILNQLMLIKRNGDRLLRLVYQLLDFRKFEAGNMALQVSSENIVEFCKEIVLIFKPYARDKGIKIDIQAQQSEINAWIDTDKIEKVLYNLISNALKFTAEGGHIVLRIDSVQKDLKEWITIKIIDDGIGIPEDRIDKIFEQYAHYNEYNTNGYGSGIGLTFSKALVELHHGQLYAESTQPAVDSKGYTCFTIELPAGKEHFQEGDIIHELQDDDTNEEGVVTPEYIHSTALHAQRKQLILEDAAGEKNIMLIVEDNLDVQQFIADHFEEFFDIKTANNGKEGLRIALDVSPDIIISDVMMPEMSGIELCQHIKTDSRTSHIPLILLTARTPLLYKIEGIETGADDYITKPFNLRLLEARVWNLLEARKRLRDRYKENITLEPKNIAITSPDVKFLERVMSYIEKNLDEPGLNVEEIGKEIGMSRVTLYRKIKALTNQTVIEFIRSIRLKRAAQLLEQNQFNINEIAYIVGFTDVDYFRKCFKERFGKTPKEYAHAKRS
mgnify:CR=1 FL=1